MILRKAQNKGGVISIDDQAVNDAKSLVNGEAQSEGLLLIDESGAYYLAFPVEDLKSIKQILIDIKDLANSMASTPMSQGSTLGANPQVTLGITKITQKLTALRLT